MIISKLFNRHKKQEATIITDKPTQVIWLTYPENGEHILCMRLIGLKEYIVLGKLSDPTVKEMIEKEKQRNLVVTAQFSSKEEAEQMTGCKIRQ